MQNVCIERATFHLTVKKTDYYSSPVSFLSSFSS